MVYRLKQLGIRMNDPRRDDLFSAGILGLVEAAHRYDFAKYLLSDFKKYAGYWIKKEVFEELYGANARAHGKIKMVPYIHELFLEDDDSYMHEPSSKNYESKDRCARRWDKWIGYILLMFDINQREFAELIGVHEVAVSRWRRCWAVPSRENQKKIVSMVENSLAMK